MPELTDLLKKGSLSMILESYDAIFSDFDPRPYSERAISDDFILEANKVVRENKGGTFEMHFLIPQRLKNPQEETVIKHRLHQHFRQTEHGLKLESKKIFQLGLILTILGLSFMFFASISSIYLKEGVAHELIRVFFEPAGWFMVWYGLDKIFYDSNQKRKELEFNQKMTKAEILFDGY